MKSMDRRTFIKNSLLTAASFSLLPTLGRAQPANAQVRGANDDIRVAVVGFGGRGKDAWERDPAWQPLRKLIETLLVTWDWGEAFAALNLGAKPVLDGFFLGSVAETARARGDYLLGEIFFSLAEDGAWHRAWAQALATLAESADAANRSRLADWTNAWSGAAAEAIAPLARELGMVP